MLWKEIAMPLIRELTEEVLFNAHLISLQFIQVYASIEIPWPHTALLRTSLRPTTEGNETMTPH
jgi:hypothetical protein